MPSVGLCLSVIEATCLCSCIHPSYGLFGCYHLWDASSWCRFAWCIPFLRFMRRCYACLACFVPPIWLFFASLHACLHVYAWVCVSSILQSNGTMDTQFKPTFVLLGHPLLFDNMFVCPCLSLPLIACLLACFPFTCFFACLLACFFCHCMYTHGAWTLWVRVRPPRPKQKGQGCARRRKPTKGNV